MSFESLVELAQQSMSDPELNQRYAGANVVRNLGVQIPAKVRNLEVVVNWPRLVVDAMAETLTVDGFESETMEQENLDFLWATWQQSKMKTLSHMSHVEAMVQGDCYVLVGRREDGSIRTTAMSRDNVAVERDASGEVSAAVITRTEKTEYGSEVSKAYYYTPGLLEEFQQLNGVWVKVKSSRHSSVIPVIPIVNKSRIGDKSGASDMSLVIPYGDVASRSFTLLQFAVERLSMPQRWIIGGELANFKRQDGTAPTLDELYLGSFLTSPKSDTKFGQFDGADLSQVIAVLKHCAEMVSAMTGIPVSMLGVTTSNPSSAEAMRASKERMISRGEFKQDMFGDAWEQWCRVVLDLSGRRDAAGQDTLNSVWRDIAVPSTSAKSSYLLQAHAQGVISARTARDGLPLSPSQRARENLGVDAGAALGLSGAVVEG